MQQGWPKVECWHHGCSGDMDFVEIFMDSRDVYGDLIIGILLRFTGTYRDL